MRRWLYIILALAVTLPALYSAFAFPKLYKDIPLLAAFVFGLGVVGAAFLLAWACEVAQLDIPASLALSVLALIAVLPEYAVDFSLTYQAATDKQYEALAVANMIGANRMIVGFAWPLIILIFWLRFRKREVTLEKSQRVEVGFLGIAGLYSLTIPLKGHIDFIDVGVLVLLFIVYTVRISRAEVSEPELIGPAEVLGSLPQTQRRLTVLGLIVFAAFVIFVSAHPFAESLVYTGEKLGIDETFMVQWFAPLASEAPEIVICVLFTLRGLASAGLGALVASKVNQWTLLVGTLPLVFVLGKLNNNRPFSEASNGLPLNSDQIGAMFVTSGQTLLAVAIMLNLSAHLWEAAMLFGLLVSQFFFPDNFLFFDIDAHYVFGTIYIVVALVMFFRLRHEILPTLHSMFDFRKHPTETPILAEDKVRAHALDKETAIAPASEVSRPKGMTAPRG